MESESQYAVYFETNFLSFPINYPQMKISKIIKHENYSEDIKNPNHYSYDLALLKLLSSLSVSKFTLFFLSYKEFLLKV